MVQEWFCKQYFLKNNLVNFRNLLIYLFIFPPKEWKGVKKGKFCGFKGFFAFFRNKKKKIN
jgi:hypothetical protein